MTFGSEYVKLSDRAGAFQPPGFEWLPPFLHKREGMEGIKYPAEVLLFWPGREPMACCTDHASLLNGAAILCNISSFMTLALENTKCIICYDGSILKDFEIMLEEL